MADVEGQGAISALAVAADVNGGIRGAVTVEGGDGLTLVLQVELLGAQVRGVLGEGATLYKRGGKGWLLLQFWIIKTHKHSAAESRHPITLETRLTVGWNVPTEMRPLI